MTRSADDCSRSGAGWSTGEDRPRATSMTLLVDPPLLLAGGYALGHHIESERMARGAAVALAGAVLVPSAMTYLNRPVMRPVWGATRRAHRTGSDSQLLGAVVRPRHAVTSPRRDGRRDLRQLPGVVADRRPTRPSARWITRLRPPRWPRLALRCRGTHRRRGATRKDRTYPSRSCHLTSVREAASDLGAGIRGLTS